MKLASLKEERAELIRLIEEQERVAKEIKNRSGISASIASSASAISPASSAFDDKFLESNAKLEIRVLIPEIRRVLPLLEQDALLLERQLHMYEKDAQHKLENSKLIPDEFILPIDGIRLDLDIVDREISTLSQEIESVQTKNALTTKQMEEKILQLRKELTTVAEEKLFARETRDMYKRSLEVEEARILKHEYFSKALEKVLDDI